MALMRFWINDDGERVTIPEDSTPVTSGQAKSEAVPPTDRPARQASKTKDSPYILARATAEAWGRPLVWFAGEFYSFDLESGWVVVSNAISDLANKVAQANSEKTVLPIMRSHLSLPVENTCESVYWRRTGSTLWDFTWSQLVLSADELLFNDMIYDIVTNESEPLTNQVVFGPSITLKYEGDVEVCNEFEAMVRRQFPDPAERAHFQEVASTVLQPHVALRGQIVLHGAPYSRKTTLLSAIASCPNGRNGVAQAQEAELVRDKWITNMLVNKFANISDDSRVLPNWVHWMKRYTSGNMVVEPKYGKPMSVTPTAKLLSSCNAVQALQDASGAASDRLFLFQFDHSFEKIQGSGDDERMTVRYWSNKQRRLGILSWLLEGLERLRKRGFFEPPISWKEKLEIAKDKADPLVGALKEAYQEGTDDDFVATEDIITTLKLQPDTKNTMLVHAYVDRLFPKATKYRKKIGELRRWGYARLTNQ